MTKEERKAKRREYYLKSLLDGSYQYDPEKQRKYNKANYERHKNDEAFKKKNSAAAKRWREENREYWNAYQRNYWKKKRLERKNESSIDKHTAQVV